MANVQVIQRNAHFAGAVRLEFVNGRDGKIAKGTVTIISNTRWGSGESRGEAATAIQWILWGSLAENAAEYLSKGSHVNVIGRVRNNNYEKNGERVYGMEFTVEELDYLDSRAQSEARRDVGTAGQGDDAARRAWVADYEGPGDPADERGRRDDQGLAPSSKRKPRENRQARRPVASES